MAMNRQPALSAPTVCLARSKKYCLKMLGSRVVPDLLETMNKVFARLTLFSNAFTCAGSVESSTCSSGKPAILPKVSLQHIRTQAGTTHAQQQDVGEVFLLNVSNSGAQFVGMSDLVGSDIEPAHPVGFVRACPERGIVPPEPAHLVACPPVVNVCLNRTGQGLGRLVSLQSVLALISILYSSLLPPEVCQKPRRTGGPRRR